jgi:hypothetical protein
MNVTICSPFRDSAKHVSQFISQAQWLDYPEEQLRFVAVEGDSTDDTYTQLQEWTDLDCRVTLLTCVTGRPHYGSIVHPERFATLAQVFNTALDAVSLTWSDYALFTPSDVCFGRDVLTRLLAHDKDLIAPFFWGKDGLYHDTWAFTRNGQSIGKVKRGESFGNAPMQMETVGGMVLMRADVLRAGCRYSYEDVDRGLCKQAHAAGFTVWADPTTHITHV